MHKAKHLKLIYLLTLLNCIELNSQSFDSIWFDMQSKYSQLKTKFLESDDANKFVTTHWKMAAKEIDKLLEDRPNINFLNNYFVGQNMVRGDFTTTQKFEECYLEHCLSKSSNEILKRFKDADNNLLSKPSKFNLSVNTLGHLFYAIKVAESLKTAPKTIVEFGGGYGNLAHIFKQIYPQTTIIIFDILESIGLQYIFLKYTNPNLKIIIQEEPLQDYYEKNAIYLVPVNFLEQSNFNTDIFISTFAITESSDYIQNLVMKKKFFNANLIYIVGQLNGWKESGHAWMTDHKKLIEDIRTNYKTVNCNPFHHFQENLMSYELIGIK